MANTGTNQPFSERVQDPILVCALACVCRARKLADGFPVFIQVGLRYGMCASAYLSEVFEVLRPNVLGQFVKHFIWKIVDTHYDGSSA